MREKYYTCDAFSNQKEDHMVQARPPMQTTQFEPDPQKRADEWRPKKITRVYHTAEEYEKADKFREVALTGGTKPPVAFRTPGRGAIMGNNLVDRAEVPSVHLIQCAYVEPGNRKYLHHHVVAETIWVIVEGEGEFYGGPDLDEVHPVKVGDICHALPGQWHGLGNTGSVRLKYISIEGPQPLGGGFDTTVVAE
jgi:mannose-6-phosphate isomerase-like protein (cupin superfamily)